MTGTMISQPAPMDDELDAPPAPCGTPWCAPGGHLEDWAIGLDPQPCGTPDDRLTVAAGGVWAYALADDDAVLASVDIRLVGRMTPADWDAVDRLVRGRIALASGSVTP